MPRRQRVTREATQKETIFCTGGYKLSEVFITIDESGEKTNHLDDMLKLARQRIIGVFRHAKMTTRKHVTDPFEREFDNYFGRRGTRTRIVDADNYIVGLNDSKSELGMYIYQSIRNRFVTQNVLRDFCRLSWTLELSDYYIDQLVINLTYDLLLLELSLMVDEGEVWYDQSHSGIWQLKQSVVDEHLKRRDAVRRAVKFDQRPEHGQVRAHRKRRERPSGTSTGEGRNSRAVNRASW